MRRFTVLRATIGMVAWFAPSAMGASNPTHSLGDFGTSANSSHVW
jgi:hypothetical protein